MMSTISLAITVVIDGNEKNIVHSVIMYTVYVTILYLSLSVRILVCVFCLHTL